MGSVFHFDSAHSTESAARAQVERNEIAAEGAELDFQVKPPFKPLKKRLVILQKGDEHQVAFNSGAGELWVRGSEEPVGSKGKRMGVEEGRAYYRELVSKGYKKVLNW